jgi:lactoylglutathione lyase
MGTGRQFAHTALTVADMDRSIAFYQELGFTQAWTRELADAEVATLFGLARVQVKVAYLVLGANALELYQFAEQGGRDMAAVMRPFDRGVMHISVLVSGLDELYATLAAQGHQPYSAPVSLSGGVRAVMVRDPDGVAVELFEAAAG